MIGSPFEKAVIFSADICIKRPRASREAHAICGVIIRLGATNKGLSSFIGSAEATSVAAARGLRGTRAEGQLMSDLLIDSADELHTDGWNIFFIGGNLRSQQNLQFKVTNNSGGNNDITFAFMRLV